VPTLEDWQIDPYCQPAREVGGDFYEFYQLGDGRVGFAVGDATGKGVPALP
jgi:phosphoserine phosphatase RsbU/P